MELTRENIDQVVDGISEAIEVIELKNDGLFQMRKVLEENSPTMLMDFIRAMKPLIESMERSSELELENARNQLAQVLAIKDRIGSNIIIPSMQPPSNILTK